MFPRVSRVWLQQVQLFPTFATFTPLVSGQNVSQVRTTTEEVQLAWQGQRGTFYKIFRKKINIY